MNTAITNSSLTAVINSKGAELISLKTIDSKEYIWEGNPEFWGKHSPVLFPIVGTLKDNFYTYENTEYYLSRHGFARDMEFTLTEKSESKVTYSLTSTEESFKVYPFDFEFQITYTLDKNKLTIAYTITNLNNTVMPFLWELIQHLLCQNLLKIIL